MLPSAEDFDAAMQDLGVGKGMQVVIYDSVGLFQRPGVVDVSILWTLRVAILDELQPG